MESERSPTVDLSYLALVPELNKRVQCGEMLTSRRCVYINYSYANRCLKCCFWCLEKFLKFLNKNAYIEVSFQFPFIIVPKEIKPFNDTTVCMDGFFEGSTKPAVFKPLTSSYS